MKKKTRNIVVDDVEYVWLVRKGRGEKWLKVFRNKVLLFEVKYDQYSVITPQDVKDLIQEKINKGKKNEDKA